MVDIPRAFMCLEVLVPLCGGHLKTVCSRINVLSAAPNVLPSPLTLSVTAHVT